MNLDDDVTFQLRERVLRSVSALMDAEHFAQFHTPAIQKSVKDLSDKAYSLLLALRVK